MLDICFITNKYPNSTDPNVLVFLQQLIWTMCDLGVHCTVICPMPVNINPLYLKLPYHSVEITENGNYVDVYRPKYFGLGDEHRVLGFSPAHLTANLFTKSVITTIRRQRFRPDIIYAHFIEPAGVAAARIGRLLKIPSYVAYGEATFNTIDCFGTERIRREFSSLAGVVAVATQNKDMLLSRNIVPIEKISVFPNGYRPERFFPRDKIESRRKFGLPQGTFIVAFVGSFDERKGIARLNESVDHINGVYMICAGKGSILPTSTNCLWRKPVNNDELPYFYSAADVFVLPTLNEGCCNAIIEAMACGLPIISSNRTFNDDILDDSCSLRIDPESISDIQNAITKLFQDKSLRKHMAEGSLKKALELTLKNRAERIMNFMKSESEIKS